MRARSSRVPTRNSTRARSRGEGGTSAVEFAIVAPIFLILIFLVIEGGLYFEARNTAQSAAREGVSYLRLAGNNSDPQAFVAGAEHVTQGYAAEVGRLKNVTAVGRIDTKTGRVNMLVVGEVILPLGGSVQVQQTADATLEQFRGDTRDGP